jgi:hypothetical protein
MGQRYAMTPDWRAEQQGLRPVTEWSRESGPVPSCSQSARMRALL